MNMLRKMISVVMALCFLIFGAIGASPFVLSEIGRRGLIADGERIEGRLMEVKEADSSANTYLMGLDGSEAGGEQAAKRVGSEEDKDVGDLKAGRVEYVVKGRSYSIVRTNLDPDDAEKKEYEIIYDKQNPEVAIFADTRFPWVFMLMTLALVGVCLVLMVMVLRVGFRKGCNECSTGNEVSCGG